MARPTDPDRIREIRVGEGRIAVRLKEAAIDRLAIGFCKALDRHEVGYAIVGGYSAILLGRPRESDDVDIIASSMTFGAFAALHRSIVRTFECLTPGEPLGIYTDYLAAGAESTALRYARPGTFVPNIEFKFAKKLLDHRAVRRRIPLSLNGHPLSIAPLEMQIGYKLYMGSPKDFEDARWIYQVAGERLDEGEIWRTAEALGISRAKGRRVLGVR